MMAKRKGAKRTGKERQRARRLSVPLRQAQREAQWRESADSSIKRPYNWDDWEKIDKAMGKGGR